MTASPARRARIQEARPPPPRQAGHGPGRSSAYRTLRRRGHAGILGAARRPCTVTGASVFAFRLGVAALVASVLAFDVAVAALSHPAHPPGAGRCDACRDVGVQAAIAVPRPPAPY